MRIRATHREPQPHCSRRDVRAGSRDLGASISVGRRGIPVRSFASSRFRSARRANRDREDSLSAEGPDPGPNGPARRSPGPARRGRGRHRPPPPRNRVLTCPDRAETCRPSASATAARSKASARPQRRASVIGWNYRYSGPNPLFFYNLILSPPAPLSSGDRDFFGEALPKSWQCREIGRKEFFPSA